MLSGVMTVQELAKFLKIHPSTVYRLLKQGRLPAFKVGSDWRFSVESINRWLLEQEAPKKAKRTPPVGIGLTD